MKITKHISFFYLTNRIIYINNIIDETNKYEITTDLFIHTNSIDLQKEMFHNYTNGYINIIYHDLSNIHPYYLTWKCRELLQQQKNDYDIFMYIEDDILVPYKAIQYWLEYNQYLIEMNYNLGFVRIEVENNIEYITDLYGETFDTIIHLHLSSFKTPTEGAEMSEERRTDCASLMRNGVNEKKYCVNNKNPYCAFWIYNKNEFNKFVNSKYYDINNISGYGTREQSAIGLHGLNTQYYKNTLIPIVNNKLIEECKIYHMPNNYVLNKDSCFATIKFDDAIQ